MDQSPELLFLCVGDVEVLDPHVADLTVLVIDMHTSH
jgi:hypothetical protein